MALSIVSIFIFQGLIFLGLIFMLRHFMRGNVRGELSHLEKLNDELMKREAELRQKIAQTDQEYSTKMALVEKDVVVKQSQAKQEATKMLEESREQALKEREKIVGEAINTREKIRQEIMAEMEGKAIEYAREILSAFFSGALREGLHESLVDQLVEGIKKIDLEKFQIQSDVVVLKSSEPLQASTKDKIVKALKQRVPREISFKEEVDPVLVAGVLLQFGSFVMDGTMINRLREAAVQLKTETKRKYQGIVQ